MKKLFISCPMKGRDEVDIRHSMNQMHKIAEIVFDQELEVIPTYITHNPPKNSNEGIWYLAESIKKLAKADYFIGIGYSDFFRGCSIESTIARDYGIPHTQVDYRELMPDALEVERKHYDICCEVKHNA